MSDSKNVGRGGVNRKKHLAYEVSSLSFDCLIFSESGQLVQSVHINQKIRKLLAIGSRFAIILLPYVDSKFKNLG